LQLGGFDEAVAIVTGGARGIGACICANLVGHGARVASLDLLEPESPEVLGIRADVSDPKAVDEAFSTIERELGKAGLLVLGAGVFIVEPFAKVTLDHWQRTLAVNLTAPFVCAQRALPAMRSTGYGRIVAIGSSAGITGGASSCAAYAASKAGVMCLVKSIANEYAAHGITANAVAPALIDTAMMAEQPEGMEQRVPVGRLGRPEEVADLVTYLLSAHAGFITGEVIDINGGFLVD
jgi:NAD(P)-dependent dehydrogenase (short-subunit alcohol dehydrogenase family)